MYGSIIKQLNEQKNVVIGECDICGEAEYPLQLSYTVVLICLQGRATININFKKYPVKAYDILVLAEDSIAIWQKKSADFRLFYCFIDKSFASEIAYALPNSLFSFLHNTPVCSPASSEIPMLKTWITQTDHIMAHYRDYKKVMMCNHLQNLFLAITEHIPDKNYLANKEFSRKEKLGWRFWELISKHCIQQRDVAFYADKLNITPFYLSQITKVYFNDSPKTLINRQVVLEIKALLNLSAISVNEIAARMNFDDPSYLSRYFKRETGLSLSVYRQQQHARNTNSQR
ncbi:helix-turn-helix domain-containing protein [Xenorhabdus littoralis]|uniref:helix-turn-helix domain-containing protein n=1 Tax=Xenorhabdus littoralis TaxID=2582835 RepID=UPI0029E7DED2|nr:helix-turn-helix domain-containing protein [Xenorhabdus sp. psl]MDX7992081.1 AraC family transcriptional regulator [Xenorhabdus sp. psl]